MTRPLRIELPGAACQITARGDRSEDTFVYDADSQALLGVLAQARSRLDAQALA